MKKANYKIQVTQSSIDWVGRKITGEHNGTIAIKEGNLSLEDGQLTGGKFVVDSRSIKILDITDPTTNAQFAGHLASDDFFSSARFPEALLEITSAERNGNNTYSINGDLTIKGITHPILFNAKLNANGDDTITASGKIVVDRTKYEMKFRSGNFFQNLGDTLIYNDFTLDVNIAAKMARPF